MKVTITEYRDLPVDGNSNELPMGGYPSTSQKLVTAGNATTLADETRFIRVATDTAIHLKQGTGVDDTDPMLPANTVEYFAASEGITISIITA